MTPTQLRAFACVARLGSVKAAAGELGVSEAAVSMHVAQLRKEFDDPLFTRTAADLDVELSVRPVADFPALLASRTVDVAIGPAPSTRWPGTR